MGEKFLNLANISAYKRSLYLSNNVWNIVIKWDYFPRKTAGEQFIEAIDLVSANIAEGFGRYQKKDKIRFYRISLGSISESFDWAEKSRTRNLINNKQYADIIEKLKEL